MLTVGNTPRMDRDEFGVAARLVHGIQFRFMMPDCERLPNKAVLYLMSMIVAGLGTMVPAYAEDDPYVICTGRLKAIHKALVDYERKHQQWPDHLSDLVPEFLPDPAASRDPADSGTGNLDSDEAHPDPKFRVSYSYERNSDVSNGLAQPLGPFPKADIPQATWGSWRLVNARMESFFGDQVPVVRCYHHRVVEEDREAGHDSVLNLTPSGRIYQSDYDWRRHPDSLDFLLRTLDRDLSQPPGWVLRSWLLWRLDEFLSDETGLSQERHGSRMKTVAEVLLQRHGELKAEERTSCRMAARLFKKSGLHDRAGGS